MISKTYRLTKDGVAELQAELDALIAERREVADRIKTAREFGDLTENSEYQTARQEQEKNEARISELEHILANVELIKAPKSGGKVQLGRSRSSERKNQRRIANRSSALRQKSRRRCRNQNACRNHYIQNHKHFLI
jgi:transcription elongation GreA/GreB family factor